MPGIVGIVTPDREWRSTAICTMVKCMMHEPFYTSGTLEIDSLSASLGWICHKGSFSDCMPAWNESQNVSMIG